jgi:hypothetical protein
MRAIHLVAVGGLAMAGCTPSFVTQDESQVILRVTRVEATAGGEGTGGIFLLSDVKDTSGGVFNDNVALTVESVPKNGNPGVDLGKFNDVIIERFQVQYVRSDGRNVEGVDVPYRISGDITQLVPAGGTGTVAFVVVRHAAKEEAPLVNLAVGDGAKILTVFAEMTLYGHTTNGKAVTVTGSMQITFGNFVKAA